MADKKISDLTAVTTVASGDLAEIETAGGNSRKVTASNAAKSFKSLAFSGALVKKAADQTAADYSSFGTVGWDAEEYDTDAYHDNATNNSRLTVPIDGYYVVTAQVGASNLTASDYFRIGFNHFNSSNVLQNQIGLPASPITEISNASPVICVNAVSAAILCVAGDYFTVQADTESDTSITIVAAQSWFSIRRVG